MGPYMAPLPESLRFEHFGTDEGLSQSSVFFIFQDQRGFLWVGTQDGLNRYDGYNFTVFRNDPANPGSLSHNSALCIEEDPDGYLWVGTWGGGLNRYDPQTGLFTRYQHNPNDPASLGSDNVSTLYLDRDGQLWVGTMDAGLDLLDRATGKFSHNRAAPGDPYALSSNAISAILEDPGGDLWLGTGGYGVEGSGLDRFNPTTGRAIHYQFKPNDPHTLSSNTISSLAFDLDGFLWVATGGYLLHGRGINRLDTHSGQVTRFQHDTLRADGLNANDVMSLYLDLSGVLWIGTWGGGLDRLDPRASLQGGDLSPRFVHYTHDPYDSYSLSADTIWTIFQDRTGVLWFGSMLGGMNKINPLAQRFHLYRNNPGEPASLAGNSIGPMMADRSGGDRSGSLWVGTLGFGLERFDQQASAFFHYSAGPDNPARKQANTYQALLQDKAGSIWVGTMLGLAKFDRSTGQFTYYYHDPRDPSSQTADRVTALVEDSSGRLWVANQSGLDWFDTTTNRFTHMNIQESGPGSDVFIDHLGRLWFGTQGKGLFRLDLSTLSGSSARYTWYHNSPKEADSLGDDTIIDIFSDSLGTLWLATGRGLDHLDAEQRSFTHYRVEDGLASNTALCMLEDDQGRLWISTNQGISRYDRFRNQFRTFDALDGLQGSEFNPRSCLRGPDGEMYFGGVKGLSAFNPQDIQDNPFPPPVAITSFRVYNQPVAIDYSGRTPVQLSYQQDFISFEFVALDFHVPQKNQLEYKLDGIDKDWVKADIGRFASYTRLPGGTYVFRVRGSNNDGIWSEKEAAIPIQVASPFWEMLWFRAGVVVFLALTILLGVRVYIENNRVQRLRLEALVEQRTVTLRQTNERLQQEIEQRQKAESVLAQKAAEEAVAAERSRLARDLHDAVTQTLFSASLTAEVLPDLWKIDPNEAEKSTEDLRHLTRGALAEMRALLLELRPAALTQARFEDLLRQLTEAVIGRARLPVDLQTTGQRSLPPEVQVALYRIAQETLNNIVKYAKATQVCIELHMSPAGLLLSIRDNGVGFDPSAIRPTSLGLRFMRERAEGIGAEVSVTSAPGRGTLIEVTWNDPKPKELS